MRRLILVCLLLSSCTVGITRKEQPVASSAATQPPQPTSAAQPTHPPPTPSPGLEPTIPAQEQALTPTPTNVQLPPPTADIASPGPDIQYLRSNVERAAPGESIVLEWASTGATQATLYYVPLADPENYFYEQVDGTASKAYEIPPWEGNNVEFRLEVQDEAGRTAQAAFHLQLICPNAWFFAPAPDECGASPLTSAAAEQRFEHGAMIWVQQEWSRWLAGENWVFVLYDDGQSPAWQVFEDQWREGQDDRDPTLTPPPDLQQPIRGFGLVWREQSQVRQRLGWATEDEKGFSTTVQRTVRFKDESVYLRAHDGNVWLLGPNGDQWRKIAAQN